MMEVDSTECDTSLNIYIAQSVACVLIIIILIVTIIWIVRLNKGIRTKNGEIKLERKGKYKESRPSTENGLIRMGNK